MFPSWRFSFDGEDYFAHEKANHTVHRSHGYLHDIAYCVIQGVCDISCKENKLFTKTAWLLYFFFLDVEIKYKQPFLLRLDTQLDIDLAIRWVSVGEVIIN